MTLKHYPHIPLTDWMRNNNVSVVRFAEKINVTPAHVNQILNLKRGMSKELLKKIHTITGISIESLLYPEENLTENNKNKAA